MAGHGARGRSAASGRDPAACPRQRAPVPWRRYRRAAPCRRHRPPGCRRPAGAGPRRSCAGRCTPAATAPPARPCRSTTGREGPETPRGTRSPPALPRLRRSRADPRPTAAAARSGELPCGHASGAGHSSAGSRKHPGRGLAASSRCRQGRRKRRPSRRHRRAAIIFALQISRGGSGRGSAPPGRSPRRRRGEISSLAPVPILERPRRPPTQQRLAAGAGHLCLGQKAVQHLAGLDRARRPHSAMPEPYGLHPAILAGFGDHKRPGHIHPPMLSRAEFRSRCWR